MPSFSHLHCHTQFSLLDGAADIPNLFKKAAADGMSGIAITDHGNMFGVFNFVAEANKYRLDDGSFKVKPIVGCEFYMVEDRFQKAFTKGKKDVRYHQLLLAKNAEGYQNLTKLCSLGYIDGFYGKWPRIDKKLLLKHHEGLIATTCCIGAIVPQMIIKEDVAKAEAEFKWWLDLFGDDYYIEIQRHYEVPNRNRNTQQLMDLQVKVNEVLLGFAQKHNVKVICTNDSHYVERDDYNAHDILLCVNTGDLQKTPIANDEEGGKGYRFGFPNDQFYFKTTDEMLALFKDIPQSLDNTQEIVDKITPPKIKQDILLPNFPLPQGFTNQDDYLEYVTMEGARKKYGGELQAHVVDRLQFELGVIRSMGFAGYFLIVMDFIEAARNLDVFVGPGRGSAAGSAVAYAIGITNIDPIKYDLLFERFLNPDRKSMPDIDTDFDDEGRQKVIEYVCEKYGKECVAQIVTYGTMAARSSIKDVARVLDLPLAESNALAKLVPEKPGISLKRVLNAPIEGAGGLKDKEGLDGDAIENCKTLRDAMNGNDLKSEVLKAAIRLEGSVRNTGVHAAGIIIAPKPLSDILPVCVSKDSTMPVTQFEGSVIEDAGVIKMDFLGLKNLTIIKNSLRFIKENYGEEIDIEKIPIDDRKTYELFQRGDTNGIFQFESDGMKKYLRDLIPDRLEDLIAMNALYRPGPLQYVPNFINRKLGKEEIVYDLPETEEYLKDTYGITVYQEQLMLLSQKLGGFSKGDADVLRKAMGKKQRAVLDKMKTQFMTGTAKNNLDATKCEKIWTDWEAFAQYAFNKSHSTCYAWIAYQTAYLKANYVVEYMTALLINAKGKMEDVEFLLTECKYLGIKVLPPDINSSGMDFKAMKDGTIRFGMSSIKGIGDAAVAEVIRERTENGQYTSIWDVAKRVNPRTVTKKFYESMANAGGLDAFGLSRATYFASVDKYASLNEYAMRWGAACQEQASSASTSLFGEATENTNIEEPKVSAAPEYNLMEKLNREKEVIGLFLSGHPLDPYRDELRGFTNCTLDKVNERRNQDLSIGGLVTDTQIRTTAKGTQFGIYKIQDFDGDTEISLFGEDFVKFSAHFQIGNALFIKAKSQPRWRSETDYELKVKDVQLLDSLASKIKGITLFIEAANVTEMLMNELLLLCENNKGQQALKIQLRGELGIVNLASKTISVAINDEFRSGLKRLFINYKFNS